LDDRAIADRDEAVDRFATRTASGIWKGATKREDDQGTNEADGGLASEEAITIVASLDGAVCGLATRATMTTRGFSRGET
jgi:hypothetical protein